LSAAEFGQFIRVVLDGVRPKLMLRFEHNEVLVDAGLELTAVVRRAKVFV